MAELVSSTRSADRPEVFDEADVVLQDFRKFMETAFPQANALYESAKWLLQDVHDLRVKHPDDKEVAALFENQSEKWRDLKAHAQEMIDAVKAEYAKVASVEDRAKKARNTPKLAAFGFRTPSQKTACYLYHRKFQYAFHDAKDEVAMMCNFPDGMLVQIHLLYERAEKMAAAGEKAPKPHAEPKAPHLDAADEAEATLQEFQEQMKEMHPKASSLYERAKLLWQDIHDLRTSKGSDAEVSAMLDTQAETWANLAKDTSALREQADKEFAKVIDAEEMVKKARGVYPNVAALGFPTPEQRLARHMYAKKFKYAFHDAKDEYAAMCGFPDGTLNKIEQVHEKTLKSAGPAGEAALHPSTE